MGFPTDTHIRQFAKGKTIEDITLDFMGSILLRFTDGEVLRFHARALPVVVPDVEVIATPFRADGTVKQTTEINKE